MRPPRIDWTPPGCRPSFGGGGGGGGTQATVPAAVPPVTQASAEVIQAQQDLRRQSLKKRGFGNSTIKAGDTGGWFPGNTNPSPTNPKQTIPGGAGPGAKTLGS